MTGSRATNRAMFWRIIRRLLGANRGRLFVILLALGAGAAVTAALLNLQVDAKRRLTTEFRAFGANVVVAPHDFESVGSSSFLDGSIVNRLNSAKSAAPVAYAAFLYGVVDVAREAHEGEDVPPKAAKVILAGFFHSEELAGDVVPQSLIAAEERVKFLSSRQCQVGQKAASALQIHDGDGIRLTSDLININPQEREIIIDWAEAILDEWGMSENHKALLKRFTDWKTAEESWKKRKAELNERS